MPQPPSCRNALVRAADVGAPLSVPFRSTPTYCSWACLLEASICRFALPAIASSMSPWLVLSLHSLLFAPAASPPLSTSRKSCTNASPWAAPAPPLPPLPPPVGGVAVPVSAGSDGPVGRPPPPLPWMSFQHQSWPSLTTVASNSAVSVSTAMSRTAVTSESETSLVSFSLAPSMSSMSLIAWSTLSVASLQDISWSAAESLSSAALTRSSMKSSAAAPLFADDDSPPPPLALLLSSLRKKPGATKPVIPSPPSSSTTMATNATITPVFFFGGGG